MSNAAHKTWAGTSLVLAAVYVATFEHGSLTAIGALLIGSFLILMAQVPEGGR